MKNLWSMLFAVVILTGCATQEPESVMCSRCITPSAANSYSAFFSVRTDTQPDLAAIASRSCARFNGVKVHPYVKEHYALYDWYSFQCNGYEAKKTPVVQAAKQEVMQQQPNTEESKTILDDAKKKCVDLGFKVGTEGFGKCVLRLSK